MNEGVTFDDVMLVPQRSFISSRRDVDVSTNLTQKIKLNLPLVSSPMSTVTESRMAIELARLGGLGFIHRNMPILKQVGEVLKVKRAENTVIENPCTLHPTNTVDDALKIMNEKCISGIPIIDNDNYLKGILTRRDIDFERNLDKPLSELMTKSVVTAPAGTTQQEAERIFHINKVEKLPLIDKEGRLVGLITSKDMKTKRKYPNASKDRKGRLMVGASVGVVDDYLERAHALAGANVDVLIVFIAHGHLEKCIEAVRKLKKEVNVELVVGNVVTAKATRDLIEAGADCVNVGVGPGAACTTRLVAGVGVPQITAIMNCYEEAKKFDIPIIADGGVRRPGDFTKALAAGANLVMCGQLFAGTEESPGKSIVRNGQKYKAYYGMASATALEYYGEEAKKKVPEGVEATVSVKGTVEEIVHYFVGGLRSGMSYSNARTLKELKENSEFIKCTQAGLAESHPHDIVL